MKIFNSFGGYLMPSLSVIIPCYNQGQYLVEAIGSIFKQNIEDLQIIIVDDGSTDETNDILDLLEDKLFIELYQQQNQGAAAARNFGAQKANKEYIAFLDADDLWHPEKIQTQFDVLETGEEIIFTGIRQFISPELMTEKLKEIQIKNKVLPGICPSTYLSRTDTFAKVGNFDEKLKLGEFIAWYLKAKSLNIKSVVLDKVLAERRIHKNNTSHRNKEHRGDYLKIIQNRAA